VIGEIIAEVSNQIGRAGSKKIETLAKFSSHEVVQYYPFVPNRESLIVSDVAVVVESEWYHMM